MKKVGKPMFFVVVAVIVLLTAMSFFGLSYSYGDNKTTFIKGAGDIRWGIDIRGGVDVTFSPPDDYDATDDEMAARTSPIPRFIPIIIRTALSFDFPGKKGRATSTLKPL